MAHILTAESLFQDFTRMPDAEKKTFFELLFARVMNTQHHDASHEQVFGHLKDATFSAQEAAEYLEVSISTLRRLVANRQLVPCSFIGRSQLFSTSDLKVLKRSLRTEL